MVQPIAQPFSEEFGNDEVVSLSSGLPFATSKPSYKVQSRSLNKEVPCVCWVCGSDLDPDYYWAQVQSMSKIRKSIKFGGPTIRALQCCGPCLRDIYRRYAHCRDTDYSLPVFCLVPVEVSPSEEDSGGETAVLSSSVPKLVRTPSVNLATVAPVVERTPQRAQSNLARAGTFDREGNRLLDRDEEPPRRIQANLSRPR